MLKHHHSLRFNPILFLAVSANWATFTAPSGPWPCLDVEAATVHGNRRTQEENPHRHVKLTKKRAKD
jgi:hypothetical protein